MPPKARIDEEVFENTLQSCRIDDINSLDIIPNQELTHGINFVF